MDFSNVSTSLATAQATMQIKSPDGFGYFTVFKDGTPTLTTDPNEEGAAPVQFHLVGRDSAAFRKRRAELFNMAQRNSKVKFAAAEEESLKTVACALTGWDNVPWKGELLEFTPENVMMFLGAYAPAFEQANEFIVDRANFTKSA